jgi:transposase
MMTTKRRRFSKEFKLGVLREVEAGKTVGQVSRERQVHPTQIHQWRRQRRQYGERAFAGNGRAYTDEARAAELERKIGQLTMENDLLKKALSRLEELDGVASASRVRY